MSHSPFRYGDIATLEEVAAALGVSKARAYQIECVALRHFRERFLARLHQKGVGIGDLFALLEPIPRNSNGMIERLLD
ncbi:MAG: hypothetical protein FIA96_11215 [Betaproteobacteria bacterium]|nr:hypothetical protein [Betaproteobacteria bacterium]